MVSYRGYLIASVENKNEDDDSKEDYGKEMQVVKMSRAFSIGKEKRKQMMEENFDA